MEVYYLLIYKDEYLIGFSKQLIHPFYKFNNLKVISLPLDFITTINKIAKDNVIVINDTFTDYGYICNNGLANKIEQILKDNNVAFNIFEE